MCHSSRTVEESVAAVHRRVGACSRVCAHVLVPYTHVHAISLVAVVCEWSRVLEKNNAGLQSLVCAHRGIESGAPCHFLLLCCAHAPGMQLDTSKLPAVLRDGTAGMSILFRISALLIWLLLVIPFPSCSVCAGDDHAAMGMQYSNSWVKACADALAKGTGGGEEQKGLTHGALAAHLKRNCGPLGGDGTGRPLSKGFGAQADEEGVVVEGAAGGSERDEEESVDSEEFHVRLSGYSTKTWLYHNQSRPLLSECCRKTSCRNDKLPRLAVEVAAGGWMGVCHGGWVRGFGVVVYACFVARLLSTHALDLIHTWPTVPSYLA
jgi:hypothetical protein